MPISDLLQALQLDPAFTRQVTSWQRLPAQPARYAPYPAGLDGRLPIALRERGIHLPYTHQSQAIAAALAGENVVVVTPTASGKTLCYNLPALHTLLDDPDARALYLFPTKALAQDQLVEIREMVELLQADITVATYDGDTPQGHRKAIRQGARLLLSNPDMLHTGVLPHHTNWAEFFAGLRLVVIDEMHTYRGVFGAHVANVLRRLRRICRFYGSDPAFILTSATIANPAEHARRLIEADVTLVEENGAPTGEKHLIFYNPPLIDPDLGLRRSSLLEAQKLGERLLFHQVQAILFARSRLRVELLLVYLRDAVAASGGNPATIRGYRGGYLPAERREIEAGLRSGEVRAVAATNALELGIDIGQLQAAVITGFPGTIASTWQQAGRAGRRQEASLAVFIAGAGALDQYIVQNPGYFFGRSPEHALANPDNLVILTNHLRCAAFELPFQAGEQFGGVQFTAELLDMLAEEGEIQQAGERYFWTDSAYPAAEISLRTASPDPIVIMSRRKDELVLTIGEMERETAPILLHAGAIYLHEGQTYLVEELDWEQGHAYVQPAEVDYYTEASSVAEMEVLAVHQQDQEGELIRGYGDLEVRSQATGYRRVKRWTHETLGYGEIDLPESVLETSGYWVSFTEPLVERLRARGLWQSDPNDYGPNWQQQRERTRARDGFRCSQCGTPERPNRQHDVHHVRPFRSFGYRPGENEAYLDANRLENLRTLCRTCHQRLEQGVRLRSGLAGLAYLLGNLAPLHLMCDPSDLGSFAEPQGIHNDLPTIILYDRIPAGIGLAERLYELQAELLVASQSVLENCSCTHGCPACAGPVPEGTQILDWNPKELTLALVREALTTATQSAAELDADAAD
ncbi:MAG: DEAD/DEAH box helicase [Caldilineales bacterium]|nr:DEAD/DEAH box helicase [Caldilineales bacterium]